MRVLPRIFRSAAMRYVLISVIIIVVFVWVQSYWFAEPDLKFNYSFDLDLESGIVLTGGLLHSHPILAEYDKVVIVQKEDERHMLKIGYDSGGFSEIPLYRDGSDYVLVSDKALWYRIDKTTGKIRKKQHNRENNRPAKYLGRFDFAKLRAWSFIPAAEDEYIPPEYWD